MPDTTKFKNNKYFVGRYTEPNEYRSWFVGAFMNKNHPCQTDKVEVLYRECPVGFIQKPHYHEEKLEILIVIEGKAKYFVNDNEVVLEKGDYLFVAANNVVSGEVLELCKMFTIHAPSLPKDRIFT